MALTPEKCPDVIRPGASFRNQGGKKMETGKGVEIRTGKAE